PSAAAVEADAGGAGRRPRRGRRLARPGNGRSGPCRAAARGDAAGRHHRCLAPPGPAGRRGAGRPVPDRLRHPAGGGRRRRPAAREEAGVIALLLREVLETPGRTAALVTPDRDLARRVAAQLTRWQVAVDDSAGRPLADTPVGAYLRLVGDVAFRDASPLSVL